MAEPKLIQFDESTWLESAKGGFNFVKVFHGPGAPTLRHFVSDANMRKVMKFMIKREEVGRLKGD